MNMLTKSRTNESPPVFYRTSSPSGPLPCSPSIQFTITQSRATGIADHILPLGDLFERFELTAPAHPHASRVAVYPALLMILLS